jgi:hypothetical protein
MPDQTAGSPDFSREEMVHWPERFVVAGRTGVAVESLHTNVLISQGPCTACCAFFQRFQNNVIEEFAPHRTDLPFRDSVLPRGSICALHRFRTQPPEGVGHLFAILAIAVHHDKLGLVLKANASRKFWMIHRA